MLFLAKRFVAGETIDAAITAIRALNAAGITATLDFLGEDIRDAHTALRTREEYLRALDAIAQTGMRSNLSVKLTAIGLLLGEAFALENLDVILERAQSVNPDPFVRIDMEGSALTQATLSIFETAYARRKNVGPVLQAYLKRTPRDVEAAIEVGARVRLCKGAYREPADIAHKDMPTIRTHYLQCAQNLLLRGNYPGIATHDPALIESVKRFTNEHGIGNDRYEFQMLYGVRPAIQRKLVQDGYRLRVYVPYGTHWAGYFYRRVAERKENALFALSAIFSK